MYVNASCRRSARCLDVLSFLPFGIMRSYPGFCRRKQLEYNPGLTHRRRAGHPRANRRTSDRPSFCGVRPASAARPASIPRFQSTHPMRGATRYGHRLHHEPADFNPRTPCGVRPLRAHRLGVAMEFQSTHPLRGATCGDQKVCAGRRISIHAPLAGCDWQSRVKVMSSRNFNPRTPCGVRLLVVHSLGLVVDFNPRTPCGVRPFCSLSTKRRSKISIHAPLAGCDHIRRCMAMETVISIHAPLAGCDRCAAGLTQAALAISIHAPLAGCDWRGLLP